MATSLVWSVRSCRSPASMYSRTALSSVNIISFWNVLEALYEGIRTVGTVVSWRESPSLDAGIRGLGPWLEWQRNVSKLKALAFVARVLFKCMNEKVGLLSAAELHQSLRGTKLKLQTRNNIPALTYCSSPSVAYWSMVLSWSGFSTPKQ